MKIIKNIKTRINFFVSVSVVMALGLVATCFLIGCQAQPLVEEEDVLESEVPSVPYSVGPTTPPGVTGPTSLPPGSEEASSDTSAESPQAIVETESIKYSLPEKVEPDYKSQ